MFNDGFAAIEGAISAPFISGLPLSVAAVRFKNDSTHVGKFPARAGSPTPGLASACSMIRLPDNWFHMPRSATWPDGPGKRGWIYFLLG